jgi:hypothetical protein
LSRSVEERLQDVEVELSAHHERLQVHARLASEERALRRALRALAWGTAGGLGALAAFLVAAGGYALAGIVAVMFLAGAAFSLQVDEP